MLRITITKCQRRICVWMEQLWSRARERKTERMRVSERAKAKIGGEMINQCCSYHQKANKRLFDK